MTKVFIGVDPHKVSATIEVVDRHEKLLGTGRFRTDQVPLVVDVDPGRFDAVLDSWVAQTGKGLVDGGLRFEGTDVVIIKPKSGVGVQRDAVTDEWRRRYLAE